MRTSGVWKGMPMLSASLRSVEEWSFGRPAASPTKKEAARSVKLCQRVQRRRTVPTYVDAILREDALELVPHAGDGFPIAILFGCGEEAEGDVRKLSEHVSFVRRGTSH